MSKFFDETMKGLLEAVAIENGGLQLEEKENMPAPTLVVVDNEKELIEEMVHLRKEQNISQKELAMLTGNKQQAISRIEKQENSPSLRTFTNIIKALGCELQIVKSL